VKVLLLNAPPLKRFGIVGQIYPPLGILYLVSYLRIKNNNFEIKVIDGYHEKNTDEVVQKLTSFSPHILGISFTTQAATGAYEVIRLVRQKLNEVFIVTGGPHPTIYPAESLIKSKADVVVMGEGEITFSELVNRLYKNSNYYDLEGIAYAKDISVQINKPRSLIKDLDSIPFPARDLLDLRRYPGYHYKKTSWDTSYISGRGCPYNCVYCSNPVWKFCKPWMRLRSPQNIADEIEYLKTEYGVREFYDQTDAFNGSASWAKKVCDEFIRRGLGIYWKVQMTVENIDEDLAQKMVQAGCWLGLIGIETGNDATAKGILKKTSRVSAGKSLSILKKYGMKTFALLMAFNVWEENGVLKYEDMNDTLNTLNFAKQLVREKKVDIISWSLTTPYPGSRLYEIAKRHQLIPGGSEGKWELWDSSENFIMKLPGISKKDWHFIKRKGKVLQAALLFKSGTFNWYSIPIYLKKIWNVIRT